MRSFRRFICEETFSKDDAKRIGELMNVDWKEVDLEQFRKGLGVEKEHDQNDELDVVKNEKDLAKVVLAHLRELPDYYNRLEKVENH
jgi:uncharacterized lipoprotein YehR (DUF1307 family)